MHSKKKKKFILSSAEFILFLTFILKLLVDLNLTRDFGDFVVQIKIWNDNSHLMDRNKNYILINFKSIYNFYKFYNKKNHFIPCLSYLKLV